MKNKKSLLISLLTITGLGAVINIIQLLRIPSDPKNAFILGFSLQRMALISLAFIVGIISLYLLIRLRKKQELFIQKIETVISDDSFWGTVLVLDFLLSVFCLSALLRSPKSYGEHEALFIRLRPTIQLVSLIFIEILILLITFRWTTIQRFFNNISAYRFNFFHPQIALQQRTDKSDHLLGIFLLATIFSISATLILLPYRQISYWLFFDESWVAQAGIICSVVLLISLLFYNRSLVRSASYLFSVVILIGIIININQFPKINWFSLPNDPIERLPSNQLIDLLYKNEIYQVMQYPLYTILAEYYPQSNLTIDNNLINNGTVIEKSLRRFGRIKSIESKPLDLLTDPQSEYLKSISQINKKIIMKRNAPAVRFYFILPEPSQTAVQNITMRRQKDKIIFIYPSQMEEALP